MPQSIRVFLRKYGYWLSLLAALAGAAYFAWQTWGYVHTLASDVLDEGLYFEKGYLFAQGKYEPFEDYGPLTNHMPLSFMIPGWAQQIFGAGLQTGRMYVFALGLVMIAGYWMAAYRLGGPWWAAAVVWTVALSNFWLQIFSLGLVQGLVNALLAWMLVFAFDQRGRWWQMALAGIFAGLLVTTRINLLPVAGFFVLYAFWLHGWRAGLAATLATALTTGAVYALYWPGILKLWAYWVPEGWLPFIDQFRSPWRQFDGIELNFFQFKDIWENKQRPEWSAWRAFWRGMRFNFTATFGVLTAMLLSSRKRALVSDFHRKTAVFLITSYLVLMAMHMWAALTARSCTFFCFENYIVFFMLLGLLAVVASAPQWPIEIPFFKEFSALIIVIGFLAGINYAADVNYTPYRRATFNFLKDGLPWLRDYIGAPDTPLWVVLQNKFGFDYYGFVELYPKLPPYFPLIEAFLVVILLIPLAYVLLSSLGFKVHSFGRFVMIFTLFLGFAFTPSKRLAGKTDTLDCKTDVIASYEAVGHELQQAIPEGETVYWQVKSDVLLLYLPQVEILPPQLNMYFSEIEGDDYSEDELDSILQYGFWSQQIDDEWRRQTDYVVVENRFFLTDFGGWQTAVDDGDYQVILHTDPVESCRGEQAEILVLQKAGSSVR